MKMEKRETMKRIELPNKERFRMLGEKKNYKYLGILGADPIPQSKLKEKIRTKYEEEEENFSKQSSTAEISSKV